MDKSGSIFNKLEKFTGIKYPQFIKDILLNNGFDWEYALLGITEKEIEKLEADVNENKHLIKDTIYETKEGTFKFLIGHRIVLLNIPQTLNAYKNKNQRKNLEKNKSSEIALNKNEILMKLLTKIKNYFLIKKIECEFSIENNITEVAVNENSIKCRVKCIKCDVKIPCTFVNHWKISNYTKHVIEHNETEKSGQSKDPSNDQINNSNLDLTADNTKDIGSNSATPLEVHRAKPHAEVQNVLR